MDVQEIDCYLNGCMIYYKHDEALSACKFCGYARRLPKNSNQGGHKEVSCEWFDPNFPRDLCYPKFTPYPEVNHRRRYEKFDLFIFADTTTQVVYLKYSKGILEKAN